MRYFTDNKTHGSETPNEKHGTAAGGSGLPTPAHATPGTLPGRGSERQGPGAPLGTATAARSSSPQRRAQRRARPRASPAPRSGASGPRRHFRGRARSGSGSGRRCWGRGAAGPPLPCRMRDALPGPAAEPPLGKSPPSGGLAARRSPSPRGPGAVPAPTGPAGRGSGAPGGGACVVSPPRRNGGRWRSAAGAEPGTQRPAAAAAPRSTAGPGSSRELRGCGKPPGDCRGSGGGERLPRGQRGEGAGCGQLGTRPGAGGLRAGPRGAGSAASGQPRAVCVGFARRQ